MINIVLSDKAYENDVYPLVKAFFPEDSINVTSEEEYRMSNEASEPSGQDVDVPASIDEKSCCKTMRIKLLTEGIILTLADRGELKETHYREITHELPKAKYKNSMKRFLYEVLSNLTGNTLPWGILTGIRPTKLVYELLEEGVCEEDIHIRMAQEYLCSEAKTAMSIRIAQRERQLLHEMDYRNGYSLYIGIPFCPTTCLYCSFTSYQVNRFGTLVEDYLKALEKEIEYAAGCFPDRKLTTVYIGGGTPTTLSDGQLDRLLAKIKLHFDFTGVKEFCVEAGRPDSITPDKLMVLKKWGVDRISINPQSMQQKTLDIIGRRHTVEDVREAFSLARSAGHENINMDIIIGLPDESPEDVADTLRQIKELNPDSLTVHTLALKRAARLNTEKDSYADRKASDVPAMLEETIHFANENSYLPYYLYRQKNMTDNLENIGYARYGREGLYNILIMEEKQTILALGAGAMSKFVFHDENRIERVDNVKSVTDYIGRIDEMITRKKDFLAANGTLWAGQTEDNPIR